MTIASTTPSNTSVADDLEVVATEGLFDGTESHGPCAISLHGGRIDAIHPLDDPARTTTAPTVQAPYVMPGLIDAHVHITGYREGIPAGRPYEPQKHFLRLCVANGVTTLRDTGNSIEAIAHARLWSERYQGPRVVAAGPLLDIPPFMWPFSRAVTTEDAAAAQVDRVAYEGVDFIKIYRNVTPPIAERIIAEAHARGLPVAGDLGVTRVVDACRAGMDSVEHAITLLSSLRNGHDDVDPCTTDSADALQAYAAISPDGPATHALAESMLANGSTLVPTFLVSRRWAFFDEMVSEPRNDLMAAVMPYHRHFGHMRGAIGARIGRRVAGKYMPIRALNRSETSQVVDGIDHMRACVRQLADAGVRIVIGTDAPNPSVVPGFAVHREIEELSRAGFDPSEVLRAVTSHAAGLLGRDDLGAVRPGAQADLLLLDADPTTDVSATQQIAGVVLRGRPLDPYAVLKKVHAAITDTGCEDATAAMQCSPLHT